MEAINHRKSIHIFKRIRFIIQQLRESGVNIGNEASDVFDMIDDLAKEALITPPRNCDVGNAEEQEQRYIQYLKDHGLVAIPGRFSWAQMPYEGEV